MSNHFKTLSAENGEHRLAQVGIGETTCDTLALSSEPQACVIVEIDLGDEDCRKSTWEVHNIFGEPLRCGFQNKIDAAFWANNSGFKIVE